MRFSGHVRAVGVRLGNRWLTFPSLKAALPAAYKQAGRRALLRAAAVRHTGTGVRCPCCGRSFRRFARFHGRIEQCPGCGSLARHRAVLLYLRDVAHLPSAGTSVLHVAPEEALAPWLAAPELVDYVSVDLESPRATVHSDLAHLPFDDASFDLIVCLHVLEHVEDDRAALAELERVLRVGGAAVIQVPPARDAQTFELRSVTSPRERQRLFGQYDHVRRVGRDYVDRIESAGFEASEVDHGASLDEEKRARLGLRLGETFFFCRKRA